MISQTAVLNQPFHTAAELKTLMPQIVGTIVIQSSPRQVVIDFQLAPTLELKPFGYPIEPVRIGVFTGNHVPVAIPLRTGLTWEHRNPSNGDPWSESLCLWFPGDPDNLKWDWTKGFESFVALVHRHLLAEEHLRRGNEWPWEDAPHGLAAALRPAGRQTR